MNNNIVISLVQFSILLSVILSYSFSDLYSDLIEYTLYEKDVTWNEAAAICAQDKAHLLSINSREKFDLIQEFKQGPWQSIA